MSALRDNVISIRPDDAYARPVTQIHFGRSHMLTANTPALAKYVLLDNAANYHKSPIARRLLEPARGQGLLIADGAPWQHHRRLVAPISTQRRIAALAPAMAEETLDNTKKAGPRVCVGASFAMHEMIVVLATILRHWRVRMVPGHKVEPLALITLRPRFGLQATVEPRAS
jgi:cytochrome P450